MQLGARGKPSTMFAHGMTRRAFPLLEIKYLQNNLKMIQNCSPTYADHFMLCCQKVSNMLQTNTCTGTQQFAKVQHEQTCAPTINVRTTNCARMHLYWKTVTCKQLLPRMYAHTCVPAIDVRTKNCTRMHQYEHNRLRKYMHERTCIYNETKTNVRARTSTNKHWYT